MALYSVRQRLADLYAQAKRSAWGKTFTCQRERDMYVADFLARRDVVEVVRCMDCEYWLDNNDGYARRECRWGRCETPDADDYCSFGERKGDNDG